jgi:integrase
MLTFKLTDAYCRSLKPKDKPYKVFDGRGLYLYVSASGSKIWRATYAFEGKRSTASFGPYSDVSLAEAREKLSELKGKLRNGVKPTHKPKAPKPGMTLREATKTYWESRKDLSEGYRNNAVRGIEMHLANLLDIPIDSIDRTALLSCLQRLDARGRHVYVRRVRMWSGQVFDWAIENEHATSNPAATIKPEKAFGRKKTKHFPALDLHEMPQFIARLDMDNELGSVLACWMLGYTWVRTKELRMMRWDEIHGDTWLIPEGKMKRARDHVIPLSRQALAILDQMRLRNYDSQYVFPSYHRSDRPISNNTILMLIARLGYKGKMSGHGWRSVASTWANEKQYNPDAIEMQLSHSHESKDKTRAAYNRAKYMDIRRPMLQDWADWLDGLKQD